VNCSNLEILTLPDSEAPTDCGFSVTNDTVGMMTDFKMKGVIFTQHDDHHHFFYPSDCIVVTFDKI
jgi:hypothetical protein